MDTPTSDEEVQSTSDAPSDGQDKNTRTATRAPSIIVGIVAAAVVGAYPSSISCDRNHCSYRARSMQHASI